MSPVSFLGFAFTGIWPRSAAGRRVDYCKWVASQLEGRIAWSPPTCVRIFSRWAPDQAWSTVTVAGISAGRRYVLRGIGLGEPRAVASEVWRRWPLVEPPLFDP
jgi:hypothetical protein